MYTEVNKPGFVVKKLPTMDQRQARDLAAMRAHMRSLADRAQYLGDSLAALQFDAEVEIPDL